MSKDEFEANYAERSGMTVERLRELGQYAAPCDCDYEHCQGWQMNSAEVEKFKASLGLGDG